MNKNERILEMGKTYVGLSRGKKTHRHVDLIRTDPFSKKCIVEYIVLNRKYPEHSYKKQVLFNSFIDWIKRSGTYASSHVESWP